MNKTFSPTAEFAAPVDHDRQTAARQEIGRIAVSFFRLFKDTGEATQDDADRVLEHLNRFTSRPVGLEMLPHGAVHKEGQLWLIHEIHTQVGQGEAKLHGSTTEKD